MHLRRKSESANGSLRTAKSHGTPPSQLLGSVATDDADNHEVAGGSPAVEQSTADPSVPLLVYDTSDMRHVLRTSEATLHRLRAAGKLPKALRLGGQLRWCTEEIRRWVEAGMPDQRTWEATKRVSEGK